MIIFGFGDRKSQELGRIGPINCPRCNNTSPFVVHQERAYFSLFFIPLIPYSTKFLLSCPVCREARQITTEEKDRMLGL